MRVIETWPQYVRRIAGSLTQAQIAAKMGGVSTSNVGRWVRGEPGQPSAENVIAFAKAFNRPALEALTKAGYLIEEYDRDRTPLSEYSNAELMEEITKRISR